MIFQVPFHVSTTFHFRRHFDSQKMVISILGKGSFKFRIIRLFYMIIRIKKQEFVIVRKTKPLVEDPTFVTVHCNKTKSKDFCQSDRFMSHCASKHLALWTYTRFELLIHNIETLNLESFVIFLWLLSFSFEKSGMTRRHVCHVRKAGSSRANDRKQFGITDSVTDHVALQKFSTFRFLNPFYLFLKVEQRRETASHNDSTQN